jgi:hypothetical protein
VLYPILYQFLWNDVARQFIGQGKSRKAAEQVFFDEIFVSQGTFMPHEFLNDFA